GGSYLNYSMGGGGGGSGYVGGAGVTNGITIIGFNNEQGNANDYSGFGYGAGGGQSINGQPGKIIITTGSSVPVCSGGSWCDSVDFSATSPSTCSYIAQAGDAGVKNYYAFECDSGGLCSVVNSGIFTVGESAIGACGTANGQTYASTASIDTAAKKCSAGTYSGSFVDNASTWTWACNGTGGGTNDSCYANKSTVTKVNGECGVSDDTVFPAAPTNDLCISGTLPPAPTGAGPWTWTCAGIGTGALSEVCNAGVQGTNVAAACGTANGRSSPSIPTTNLCSIASGGEPTPAGTGPWTWTCAGIGTGASASCSTVALPKWHEVAPF
ncbi:MAG: hypothetical protein WC470_00005, partial [Candidatus Paceibacterota bacterium]